LRSGRYNRMGEHLTCSLVAKKIVRDTAIYFLTSEVSILRDFLFFLLLSPCSPSFAAEGLVKKSRRLRSLFLSVLPWMPMFRLVCLRGCGSRSTTGKAVFESKTGMRVPMVNAPWDMASCSGNAACQAQTKSRSLISRCNAV
jgi:hypothetical protein